MGFSSHEIYMILRARNEASGVLNAFSRAISSNHKTQMDQYRDNIKGIEEKKAAIREGLRDQINAADAVIQKNREEIVAIGRTEDAVRSKYRAATNANKEQITELSALSRAYKGMIDTYSQERDSIVASQKEFARATTAKVSDVDKLIRSNRASIEAISAERDTIKTVRDAHTEKIKSQVAGIDAVIKENSKLAAAYTADAREWGRLGAEKTAQYKKEIADIQSITGASKESTNQIVAAKKRAHDSWMNQMRAEQWELGREADKFREHSRELTRRKEVIQASSREFLSSLDAENSNLDEVKSRIRAGNNELTNKRAAVIDAGKAFKQSSDAEIAALSTSINDYKALNKEIGNKKAVLRDANSDLANMRDTELDALRNTKQGYQDKISSLDKIKAKFKQNAEAAIMAQDAEIAKTKKAIETHQEKLDRLQGLGQAYMMAGTVAVVAGGMMIKMYLDAGAASREYSKAAALTFTQVDKDAQGHALVTQKAIIDMGKRVAREWPVEFSQIQPAMYDVFSSMDIKSAEIADKLMDNIAKAAVAGSVEVATAGKGIIEVINAWGMEMDTAAESARTLNRVNDVAFTLVKEGVGSYGQFSDAIGRSIPSAVKAGASYEDMAGGLAFLTRMGMSTTMASTSMGRAFDLIANPKFAANMKKYGLEVANAKGEIKPMTEIVNDLQGKMKGMTEIEAAAFLKDVTLGAGGTVQAMRFLSHATHDNAGLFDSLTQSMYDASEAGGTVVGNAYDIMANTPAAKIQELANQFEIFKITVGDTVNIALMPLVNALTRALDWFNNLSPGMQQAITVAGMVMGALLLLGGAILLIGGFLYMLSAAAASTGLALSAVFLPVTLVIAGIAALIAIIIVVINYWPQISAAAQAAWDWIVATWNQLGAWFAGIWDGAVTAVTNWANNAMLAAQTFWNDLVNWFTNIPTMAQAAWDGMVASVTAFFINAGAVVTGGISVITGMFTDTSNAWTAPFRNTWAIISETTTAVFESIRVIIAGVFLIIVGIFTGDTKLIEDAWNGMGNKLKEIWSKAWDNIKNVLETSKRVISDAISKLVSDVGRWFNDMKNNVGNTLSQWGSNVSQKVHEVVTYFQQLPGKVIAAVVSLATSLAAQANAWFGSLGAAVSSGIAKVVGFMQTLPGRIISAISGLAGQMASVGSNIMNSLAGGIAAAAGRAAQAAINAVKGAIDAAKRLLGIASPSKVFTQMGVYSGEGLAIGFTKMRGTVRSASERMVEAAINSVEIPVTASVVSAGASSRSIGAQQIAAMATTMNGGQEINIDVHTQEIDPVKHAADLGYLVGSKLGW